MLTISRKSGQRVVVQVSGHEPLVITFLGNSPGRCKLAFDGPLDYGILREELAAEDDVDEDAGPVNRNEVALLSS